MCIVLGITDVRGLTDHVSNLHGQTKNLEEVYRKLFLAHENTLNQYRAVCDWTPIKSTGDGVMFFSKRDPDKNHLSTLLDLQEAVRGEFPDGKVRIRAIASFVDSKSVVWAEQICGGDPNCIIKWLANDLFGHHLNRAFRLLSVISAPVAVVEQSLLERIYPEAAQKKSFRKDSDDLVLIDPVPITVLKGISDVGFSVRGKQPHWLWQLSRA